ncbi:MAG: acetyl-CoA hydrolase (acetyl-CoA hydrolase/transferase family protein) [Candidatus Magnetoglobus multicellularis str. Araruama]|uniref:Acetyl-CoA hydrolase (Acetyl-CoA hydrolase/transferase family protein) n=1 Tax=Candidatus Magnetoglobus multicellularis str. Araruama TaxID=890399 RepID=A0A1V1P4Z5_9BACT|nr:MAG: acetyl-CoA hydrolase (acetyl-CoA hydrolase/transferase family protein) [Candidatus Magnetoglobus multicellularis str. Araruama]
MEKKNTAFFDDVEKCAEEIIQKVGKKVIFGMPLGLGKPNELANALYKCAKKDSSIDLTILTALTLEKPVWKSELERRYLEPFVERVFGDYVDLEYILDLRNKKLPPNITLCELFIKPGGYIGIPHAQQNYISSNYTHIARDVVDYGLNVTGQIIAKQEHAGESTYSLSCNPDTALDVALLLEEKAKTQGHKYISIGQVNDHLPFMYGDAEVSADQFDMIVDHPDYYTKLFGAPKMSMGNADYMIGLNASTLIKDGGTLQIGIGSLGDGIVYGLTMRQKHNELYNRLIAESRILGRYGELIKDVGGTGTFEEGLLGSTEMLVDGYIELIKAGIVKRKTYNSIPIQKLINEKKISEKITPNTLESLIEEKAIDRQITEKDFNFLQEYGVFKDSIQFKDGCIHNDTTQIPADLSDNNNLQQVMDTCLGDTLKKPIILHAAFFLGPNAFYDALNEMSEEERKMIHMTSVQNVNHLYGNQWASYDLKMLQRKHGRFANAALMCTLSGAIVSDGLENGQVVSGVGGQYNFVSMAHALPDGRSILMLRSTRSKGMDVSSNIVWNYAHCTIPRHLRDIVITEYGIANLRGLPDKEIIIALIKIADSRFQEALIQQAKSAGKLPSNYQLPDFYKKNTPQRIADDLAPYKEKGLFVQYPFGTDLTEEELLLGKALNDLKGMMTDSLGSKAAKLGKAMTILSIPKAAKPYLQRLQLDKPASARDIMMQKMVLHALISGGYV